MFGMPWFCGMVDANADLLVQVSQQVRAEAEEARSKAAKTRTKAEEAQASAQRAQAQARKMLALRRKRPPHVISGAVADELPGRDGLIPAPMTLTGAAPIPGEVGVVNGIGVATARRHVAEAEQHVAHMRRIVEQLAQGKNPALAETARHVLQTLEDSLRLAQDHVDREERNAGAARKVDPDQAR